MDRSSGQKSTIAGIKNSLEGFNFRFNQAEERISKFGYKTIGITQAKEKKEK